MNINTLIRPTLVLSSLAVASLVTPHVKKAHAETASDKKDITPIQVKHTIDPTTIKQVSVEPKTNSKKQEIPSGLPIVAISAASAGLVSTTAFYPVQRILTLAQKNNSNPISELQKLVPTAKSLPNLYKGGSSIIAMSGLLRVLQMEAYSATNTWTEKNNAHWSTLHKDIAAAVVASSVDSAIGGTAEINSLGKQLEKRLPPRVKAAMFSMIAMRDLISNGFAFVLPKRIREEFGLATNLVNNFMTAFVSVSIANLATTVLDKIKTLKTTEGLSIKQALQKTPLKQLASEYLTRVLSIGGRMAAFLALNAAFLDALKSTQNKD